MRATPAELRDARWSRFVLPPLLGLAAALLLFWWMYQLIQPKTHGGGIRVLENVEVLAPRPQRDEMPEQALANRSEEHTSELQSLMRISYAVFCLKKKKSIIGIQSSRHKHIDNDLYDTDHDN